MPAAGSLRDWMNRPNVPATDTAWLNMAGKFRQSVRTGQSAIFVQIAYFFRPFYFASRVFRCFQAYL